MRAIHVSIHKKGIKVLILLRMQPVINKGLLGYLLGCCQITLGQHTVASAIGAIPMTLAFSYVGVTFQNFQELMSGVSAFDPVYLSVLIFCSLGFLVLIIILTRESKKQLALILKDYEENGPENELEDLD